MNNRVEDSCTESFCDLKVPLARENYYFGKLLTARGLESEQYYLNEKRWLINRYGIGWGVLCGLKVVPDPNNTCGGVIVKPGLALDQYGNEILVCQQQFIDLKKVWDQEPKESQDNEEVKSKRIYITICYQECQSEPSPVAVEECDSLESQCKYNRTIETFKVYASCMEPEKPKSLPEEFDEILTCETHCHRLLTNPAPVMMSQCPPQEKKQAITLACICYRHNVPIREHQIDNISWRKLAFSNAMLYELISCLRNELWQAKGARYDRRRYVPLLANTIPGLSYQDGKIAHRYAGIHPHRITTDGKVIWITDRASPKLIRIDRQQNEIIDSVDLSRWDETINSSWAIAFDGKRYMWITHANKDQGKGKLTRIDTCNPKDCWTFSALPSCDDLEDCQKYCCERNGENTQAICPYPQELVYHQGLLYVSHGWTAPWQSQQATDSQEKDEDYPDNHPPLRITIIDTERCCILKTCLIESTDSCISLTAIVAMVSDGDALWFTYKAKYYDKERPVVRYFKYHPYAEEGEAQCEVGPPCGIEKVTEPEKIAFDGTHLWLTHDDGASKIDISSSEVVRHIDTQQKQTAIAYGGGDNIWTAELNTENNSGEARLNRIDIHSVNQSGEIEFISYGDKQKAEYEITDAQFDGSFIYISAYYADANTSKKGVIHRVLP